MANCFVYNNSMTIMYNNIQWTKATFENCYNLDLLLFAIVDFVIKFEM